MTSFAGRWEAFWRNIFAVFYVMTEQSNVKARGSKWSMFRRYIVYLLDGGQVLRALIIPEFAWSTSVVGFTSKFDIVFSILSALPHPTIPSVLSFLVSVSLVIIALMDAGLVIYIFQKGRTSQLWPVMLLRLLVTTIVTTFFIWIFGNLLYPINCYIQGSTLSEAMLGEGAPCQPWSIQVVGITVPSLMLAMVFAIFSLTVTLLSFEVNPLSQTPGDCCTGRVETIWSTVRIFVALLRYIQAYITPIGALVILALLVLYLNISHVKTLPFHHHEFNLLRGGIYAVVLWLITACIIVLATMPKGGDFGMQQWILIAVSPAFFILGMIFAERKKRGLLHKIRHLRSEFLRQTNSQLPSRRSRRGSLNGMDRGSTRRRDAYEEFFDTGSKLIRAFQTAREAHVTVRTLLYEKDDRDIELIEYLIRRGLEEYPESKDLIMLQMIFLRFVFRDKQSAMLKERAARMIGEELLLDLRYCLYAVDRKAFQYDAGVSLGKEGISAINLMEFSGKMERARKQHLECVALHKNLWKTALKSKRKNTSTTADELIACFSKASDAVIQTKKCFEELLEKFPGSAALRLDYSSFCDVILNDFVSADRHRQSAEILETGGDLGVDSNRDEVKTVNRAASCASSNSSYRSLQRQFVASWSDSVMASQAASLRRLSSVIVVFGLILMLVTTAGFIILQFYLYLSAMPQRLAFLQRLKGLRVNIFQGCYELRTLHLLANVSNPTATVSSAMDTSRRNIQNLSESVGKLQTLNYVESPSATITNYFLDEGLSVMKVYPGLKELKVQNMSFWKLGNDFIKAMAIASEISLEDLRDPTFQIDTMSTAKRAIVFMFENLGVMITSMETFVNLILDEILFLQNITNIVVSCLVSVESLLMLSISIFVLHNVSALFPTCQHCSVCSKFVDSLPVPVLKKIYKFYLDVEKNMVLIDDEVAAKQELEHEPNGVQSLHNQHEDEDGDNDVLFSEQGLQPATLEAAILDEDHQPEDSVEKPPRAATGTFASHDSDDDRIQECDVQNGKSAGPSPHTLVPATGDTRAAPSWADSQVILPLTSTNLHQHMQGGAFGKSFSSTTSADPHRQVFSTDARNRQMLSVVGEVREDHLRGSFIKQIRNPSATPQSSMSRLYCEVSLNGDSGQNYEDSTAGCTAPRPAFSRIGPAGGMRRALGGSSIFRIDARPNGSPTQAVSRDQARYQHKNFSSSMKSTHSNGFPEVEVAKVVPDKETFHESSAGRVRSTDEGALDGLHERELSEKREAQCDTGNVHSHARRVSDASSSFSSAHSQIIGSECGHEALPASASNRYGHRNDQQKHSEASVSQPDVGSESSCDVQNVKPIFLSSSILRKRHHGAWKSMTERLLSTAKQTAVWGRDAQAVGFIERLNAANRLVPVMQVESDGSSADESEPFEKALLLSENAKGGSNAAPSSFRKSSVFLLRTLSGKQAEQTPSPQEGQSLQQMIDSATYKNLAWYFRASVYRIAIVCTIVLCMCVWLVPTRVVPDLINTTLIVRTVRTARTCVMESMFLARELILRDGFSRIRDTEAHGYLQKSKDTYVGAVQDFRLGGSNRVYTGADNLPSSIMAKYKAGMYEHTCPWRVNPANCSFPDGSSVSDDGLNSILSTFGDAVDLVLSKYSPGPASSMDPQASASLHSFERVELDPARVKLLDTDMDLRYVLKEGLDDIFVGLRWVEGVVFEEQGDILDSMLKQSNLLLSLYIIMVVGGVYGVLIRTSMSRARLEVSKTRDFVRYVPVHVLTRNETALMRDFFVHDSAGGRDLEGGRATTKDNVVPAASLGGESEVCAAS